MSHPGVALSTRRGRSAVSRRSGWSSALLVLLIGGWVTAPTADAADGDFVWAVQLGGATGAALSRSVAVDADSNVYTTGTFNGTADFDPGAGVDNLTSAGNNDVFVSKLDADGDFVWARQIGGTNGDEGYSVAVDADGNVYTTGWFSGTTDFDPGAGVFNLTSVASTDVFISKLDADGDFVWARQFGTAQSDVGYSVAVDADGNVYTTGLFAGTADFDPGAGVFNLTSAGIFDVFVSKLDTNGDFVWARQIGSTSSDIGRSVAVDADGNVYTTGYFAETADFDPGAGVFNLTSAGIVDVFVSKLDTNGDFVWARHIGGTNGDFGVSGAVDADGNVYTTGLFSGTADFDPGAGVDNLTSAGDNDVFVSKLDTNGDFVWVHQLGGTDVDEGYSVAVDADSNVYTTGRFSGTADFDPGVGVLNLTSIGFIDGFVSKLAGEPVGYMPFVPTRLMDTRLGGSTVDGQFQATGARAAGSTTELQISGRSGIPADTKAVVLNVTATRATGNGFITVYPCGATPPNTSNLNFVAGDTIPNLVIVPVGIAGKICVYTSAATDLIVDVNGYYPAGSDYTPTTAGRLMDTRLGASTVDGQFQATGARAAGSTTELQISGRSGIPADTKAVVLNVTATRATGNGFTTVYPCGATPPNTSNLNFVAGDTIPNLVIIPVGTAGKICLYTSAATDLIVDVNGYYPA
ncbi:MAG: SBBP repeat-containing protein [Actinomycetia bacterium]|nr:SBBP repeat-containing protein [Actinomycetes bacterium]